MEILHIESNGRRFALPLREVEQVIELPRSMAKELQRGERPEIFVLDNRPCMIEMDAGTAVNIQSRLCRGTRLVQSRLDRHLLLLCELVLGTLTSDTEEDPLIVISGLDFTLLSFESIRKRRNP